jgi:hypothetical protein
MKPKFISGPPGTGKTNFFIKEKYEELVKQYGHEKIIILSHTNVAADEIREVILNLPLMKEKGVRKKALEQLNPSDDINKKHPFYKFLNDAHGNGYYNNLKLFWFKKSTDRKIIFLMILIQF